MAEADDAEHSTAEGGDTVEQSADSVEQSRDHFPGPIAVEAELDGETYSFVDWSGKESLLEFLESKGIEAPYSCRLGQCSACACMVLEGEVTLANNEVLDDADLADGIRLACQAHPASEKLRVTYNG
ncbi:MAG: 2Fe-2S iron-sulfur cluster binding domain-containing protein [Nocardioides sp.]